MVNISIYNNLHYLLVLVSNKVKYIKSLFRKIVVILLFYWRIEIIETGM